MNSRNFDPGEYLNVKSCLPNPRDSRGMKMRKEKQVIKNNGVINMKTNKKTSSTRGNLSVLSFWRMFRGLTCLALIFTICLPCVSVREQKLERKVTICL